MLRFSEHGLENLLYDYKTTWDYRCGESACQSQMLKVESDEARYLMKVKIEVQKFLR
jgi:hypothetical protein